MAATKRCQEAIGRIRDLRQRACFHELMFVELPVPMTPAQQKALETKIRAAFDRWWDSWIEPELQTAEKG